ncbi:hypothetical protein GCM10018953_26920 [Streptosporangium nondiastaticum]
MSREREPGPEARPAGGNPAPEASRPRAPAPEASREGTSAPEPSRGSDPEGEGPTPGGLRAAQRGHVRDVPEEGDPTPGRSPSGTAQGRLGTISNIPNPWSIAIFESWRVRLSPEQG